MLEERRLSHRAELAAEFAKYERAKAARQAMRYSAFKAAQADKKGLAVTGKSA